MEFVDKTVVELAGEGTRGGVFDQEALAQLLDAAYDTAEMGVTGQLTADFEDFRLGWAPGPQGSLEGSWNVAGAAERNEARFRLAGLPANGMPRVDALWRGAIVARFRIGGEPITDVTTTTPDDETVEATITFDQPKPVIQTARPLPVAIALLVRPELAVAELLHDVGVVRDRLGALGLQRPHDDGLRLRRALVVSVVVPQEVFDDGDWPGATQGMTAAQQRAARRAAAGAWLSREGIGLVVTS